LNISPPYYVPSHLLGKPIPTTDTQATNNWIPNFNAESDSD
jgi:hypothetical protein